MFFFHCFFFFFQSRVSLFLLLLPTSDLSPLLISPSTGGLPLAAFNLGKVRPYQRGFFCSDDSIRYPFHHSTITSTVLYTVGFALPISCVSSPLLGKRGKRKIGRRVPGWACQDLCSGTPALSWHTHREGDHYCYRLLLCFSCLAICPRWGEAGRKPRPGLCDGFGSFRFNWKLLHVHLYC